MRDQQNDIFCLDSDYSTTRLVTREKPLIVNKPEDKFETVLFLAEGENRTGHGGLRTLGLFKRSLPDKPLITLITVVLNGAKHLEETILSVLNQTYDNVEYIVIDGRSTDGTLDIIRKYEHGIDYWVSEKDKSVYDAMNKGVVLSAGTLIAILNADDVYYQTTINNITSFFLKNRHIDFIYGSINLVDKNGMIFGCRVPHKDEKIMNFLHREIPFNHSSFFVKKNVYKSVGLYDISFKISSDYDFIIRVFKKKFGGKRINETFGAFRTDGKSSSIHTFFENYTILIKNEYSNIIALYILISTIIKYCVKFILPKKLIIFLKKYSKKTTHTYSNISQ
jgi:glycosyltransferase involved in cell wall biosynthesis